ncbi:MAG TPA: mannitol dehydrogenase family protein [Devosia sp.]|nr:mannitol dehydrogenase family protein [Devosia sp.]
MTRLSLASLSAAKAQRPTYDRAKVTPGIVHLGIGAFHRAHQAVVVDDLLSADPSWGVVGASLRRPDTSAALTPQDGLYTLLTRSGAGTQARIIGSVLEIIDAPQRKEALLARMADPMTRIVSLTVTEKGYGYNAATGHLDEANPDIASDLVSPRTPATAAGLIVEALRRRCEAGAAPVTVLSCDNLPHNGRVTAQVVTDFAEAVDTALGKWIAANVAFPATMIDRIVPATTDADRAEALALTGLEDAWPVVGEPFLQWVIEDRFVGPRPPFDLGGAQFVGDVAPYETMKLRMLNGSHSMMAYLGYLAGYEFVSQVIGDPAFRDFIQAAWREEIAPTLTMPSNVSSDYARALLERFSNPALKHRTYQIAMDGSQKLPQRLVGTVADRLAKGQPVERLALGIAAWMVFAAGTDLEGKPIVVQDPMTDELKRAGRGDAVSNFLALRRVFSAEVAESMHFREAVTRQYRALKEMGPVEAAKRLG